MPTQATLHHLIMTAIWEFDIQPKADPIPEDARAVAEIMGARSAGTDVNGLTLWLFPDKSITHISSNGMDIAKEPAQ